VNFEYTRIPGLNVWRPYVYVRLHNRPADRVSNLVPMVLDTGSDHCLFNAELAHTVGMNPLDGGRVVGTQGVGGSAPTALWPVDLELPELDETFQVRAQFGQLPPGVNGLLGNHGFIDRFTRVAFHPKAHQFELEL